MYRISTSTKFESSYSHVYVCVTLDLVKKLECGIMDYEKYEDYKFEELFFDNLFKKEEKAVEDKHRDARKKLFSKRII